MRFEPVFLPPERAPRGRASQTLLRHFSACPRSGFLYQRYKGGASSAEMVRGKAVHLVHERAVRLMLENGEVTIPAELVKTLADEVLAEMPVPFAEHDAVREMAYRMGSELALDPGTVIAAETLFALDVGPMECVRCHGQGEASHPDNKPDTPPEDWKAPVVCWDCDGTGTRTFEVRCRIDFAESVDGGARVHVEDLKSSKAAVSQEEIARKRPDGSLAARSFQLVLYAIALAYGVPVREEDCAGCHGRGEVLEGQDDEPDLFPCDACGGKGRIEIREPFPVASRAQQFDLEFVYPAIEGADEKMLRRPVSLTRVELEAYRVSLAGLVGRLAAAEVSGDWPAVVSDAACAECPASLMCPIPKELKNHRGTINTVDEAAEALEVRARDKKVAAATTKEITAFVKARGPVRFGGDMIAEIGHTTAQEIKDKEGMFAALEATRRYGEPFERERWVREKHGYPLVVRALTADELVEAALEQSEGSNGRSEDRTEDADRAGGDGAAAA